jgi:hypothetical protein
METAGDLLALIRANMDIVFFAVGIVFVLVSVLQRVAFAKKATVNIRDTPLLIVLFIAGLALIVGGAGYNIWTARTRAGSPTIAFSSLASAFQVEEGSNYIIDDVTRVFLMRCANVDYHGDQIDLEFTTLVPVHESHVMHGLKDGAQFVINMAGRDYIGHVEAIANARNHPDIAFLSVRHAK